MAPITGETEAAEAPASYGYPQSNYGTQRVAHPQDPPRELSGLAWGVFVSLGVFGARRRGQAGSALNLHSAVTVEGDITGTYHTYSTWIGIYTVVVLISAGGIALARRREVFERLSRAIDRARRETTEPRHSPPPITAAFILSGIEAVALKTLREDGGDFDEFLPGVLYFSISYYFGDEAAAAEVAHLGQGG